MCKQSPPLTNSLQTSFSFLTKCLFIHRQTIREGIFLAKGQRLDVSWAKGLVICKQQTFLYNSQGQFTGLKLTFTVLRSLCSQLASLSVAFLNNLFYPEKQLHRLL